MVTADVFWTKKWKSLKKQIHKLIENHLDLDSCTIQHLVTEQWFHIIGNTCCSVYDSQATIVSPDAENIVLYVWYDNEFGYTKQVIRMAKYISKVQRKIYY